MSERRSRAAPALRALAVVAVCAAGIVAAVALLHAPADVVSASAGAPASRGPLESMFQDDRELIYSRGPVVARTLDALGSLGVDRVRLTILWAAIAPQAGSSVAPAGFDAANPAAYPAAAWAPYDRVLRLARARGIGVDFDLTAPGPRWAMGHGPPAALATEADHYEPSAVAFGNFVHAVATRYSGTYRPAKARAALPRVGYWSIWNEPNQPGWLAPQSATVAGVRSIVSARLDRELIDAGVAALRGTGHRADTILVGELAPEGDARSGDDRPVAPLPFLRSLYCVDVDYQPLEGRAARAAGCPAHGTPAGFVAAHPGLFAATGFAHHPYSFFLAPQVSVSDVNFAPLADLDRLEQALDQVFARYGVARRLPIYLTEYGYETNPPNPYRGVRPATQAAYLDEGAYLAWRDPRVRALSQFLLRDSPPDRLYPRGSVRYWSTFQTGLEYVNGAPKPALRDYKVAIFVPVDTFAPGGAVTVWGMLRAAPAAPAPAARVQWRPRDRAAAFRTLATVRTTDRSGAFIVQVRPPRSGLVRIAWSGPGGVSDDSRETPVTR